MQLKSNSFKIAALALFCLLTRSVSAQQDFGLGTLSNLSQTLYTNPSNEVNGKVFVGIPGISSVYFNGLNTIATPKDLFENQNGTTRLRVNHLENMWRKNNYVGVSANLELLSLGFRIKEKSFLSFTVNENIFARVNMPKDLLTFPFYGNGSFEKNGGEVDLSGMGVDAHHYRSYGVGFQTKINSNWSVGAKLKYLSGINNVSTKESNFVLRTDTTTYDLSVSGKYAMYTSGIDTSDLENQNALLTGNGSSGFGLDLGVNYKLNNRLRFSASVIDLGFITWRGDNKNFISNDIDIAYSGLDFSNSIFSSDSTSQDDIDQQLENLEEEFAQQFEANGNTEEYSTSLTTRFYLGASYTLLQHEMFTGRASASFFGEIYKGDFRPAITLAYTQNITRKVQLTANYTLFDKRSNIGGGLVFALGSVQLYAIADNILAANTADIRTENGVTSLPYSAKNFHARVGMNLVFGNGRNKNKKERAKAKNSSNKDRDNDGIKNKNDICPDLAGLPEFEGCPDTDGDGIKDEDDKCPELKGELKNNGCPDTDNDGIIDDQDRCPKIAGIEQFGGCPDSDGDGVEDRLDECPNNKGLKAFKGCPDTDKDGTPDPQDQCVDVVGPEDNKGCPYPDSDGDGVLDKDDDCLKTPGAKSNNGCPIVKEEVKAIIQTAFDNLEFETAKDVIKVSSQASLDALANVLATNKDWKLLVEGHTDNVGGPKKNLKLSQDRAIAVKKYLVEKGIDETRITTKFYGETKPISSNETEEGRKMNRRVEMTLVFD